MKQMKTLKFWAQVGVWVLLLLPLLLVCGLLLIPKYTPNAPQEQIFTIRFSDLRTENELYVNQFLNSIKNNDGYLVIGTSETTKRKNGNYYDFLNADPEVPCSFSYISGAGKTACTYFSLLVNNENFENLKIIYFVNPIYWTNKLANSNLDYFSRYTSYTPYMKADRSVDLSYFIKVNQKNARPWVKVTDFLSFYADKCRQRYYQDLRFNINSAAFEDSFPRIPREIDLQHLTFYRDLDSACYDFERNMARDAHFDSGDFDVYPDAEYRYEELRKMIEICKLRHVEIVFVLGPVNELGFAKADPKQLPGLLQVQDNVRQLFENAGVDFIDATDVGKVSGAFLDGQHHNSYGAFLISKKIKNYVLEKNNR